MNICYLIIFRRTPITGPIYLPISLIQNVPQQIVSNILNFIMKIFNHGKIGIVRVLFWLHLMAANFIIFNLKQTNTLLNPLLGLLIGFQEGGQKTTTTTNKQTNKTKKQTSL